MLPVTDAMLASELGSGCYDLVFVDDELAGETINKRRTLGFAEFITADAASRAIAVAVANPEVRRRLVARCSEHDVPFFSVSAPGTVIMDDVRLGEGAILSPFVTLTSNIRIGRHFHANLYSYVEHDCTIGDFVTFAPAVKCNGNVTIEDGAYLGASCVLREGRRDAPLIIGRGAIVGMGAVVTSDIPPGATVVGNPARELRRRMR